MPRWTKKIENSVRLAGQEEDKKEFLDAFFESEVYVPQNEEEENEFAEFSLVTSSMALLISVAKADKVIRPQEKKRIIDDLIYQLQQRPPLEIQKLKEEFGAFEKEIISNIYDTLLQEYDNGLLDLDKTIKVIDMVYQKNPEKRQYLVRLCYNCAYSDKSITEVEKRHVEEIAAKLKVGEHERIRIETEVKQELGV